MEINARIQLDANLGDLEDLQKLLHLPHTATLPDVSSALNRELQSGPESAYFLRILQFLSQNPGNLTGRGWCYVPKD